MNSQKIGITAVRIFLYILFCIGGLLVILALGVVFFADDETVELAPQTQSIDSKTEDHNKKAGVLSENAPEKQFDAAKNVRSPSITEQGADPEILIEIARIKPDGAAVVAGSAPPGSSVSVFENRVLLGKTTADINGEWVVVLEKLLGPGQHLISVAAELSDSTSLLAETSIAIEIYADQKTKPLVALLPENQTDMPVLLQSPDDMALVANDNANMTSQMPSIGPRSLVWKRDNEITIAGHSNGGVKISVSANGVYFGDALVLANGAWQLTGLVDKNRKNQSFEFILVDSTGQAVARYGLPVRARDLQKGIDGSQLVVVNKGDALWRIAYRSFGKGVRYIDIVRKNTKDISNPDLIFPNQIFALPKDDTEVK